MLTKKLKKRSCFNLHFTLIRKHVFFIRLLSKVISFANSLFIAFAHFYIGLFFIYKLMYRNYIVWIWILGLILYVAIFCPWGHTVLLISECHHWSTPYFLALRVTWWNNTNSRTAEVIWTQCVAFFNGSHRKLIPNTCVSLLGLRYQSTTDWVA